MVVGLALRKLFASAMQQPVSLARRDAFQRFQKQVRRNRWQKKHVNVIRHDHKRPKAILPQGLAAKKRIDYENSDGFFPQMDWTGMRSIQITIHPRESFAIGDFAGGREVGTRQAAVQMPGKEEPTIVGINVRKAALGRHALSSGVIALIISRSHECERGTQECVRHGSNVGRGLGLWLGQGAV